MSPSYFVNEQVSVMHPSFFTKISKQLCSIGHFSKSYKLTEELKSYK